MQKHLLIVVGAEDVQDQGSPSSYVLFSVNHRGIRTGHKLSSLSEQHSFPDVVCEFSQCTE